MAWAVLCKNGEVHGDDEAAWLFLYPDQARDELREMNLDLESCGPHRVVTLYMRVIAEIFEEALRKMTPAQQAKAIRNLRKIAAACLVKRKKGARKRGDRTS